MARDGQFADGHPAISAKDITVESFEYANLDSAAAPTLASAKPDDILTFGGHRYQLVNEALTWDEAKAKAEALANLRSMMNTAMAPRTRPVRIEPPPITSRPW